jgi:hypothetical protein
MKTADEHFPEPLHLGVKHREQRDGSRSLFLIVPVSVTSVV